jgi:hypothetical protein
MTVRRVVPDITSERFDPSRKVYADFLGFNVGMDIGGDHVCLSVESECSGHPSCATIPARLVCSSNSQSRSMTSIAFTHERLSVA